MTSNPSRKGSGTRQRRGSAGVESAASSFATRTAGTSRTVGTCTAAAAQGSCSCPSWADLPSFMAAARQAAAEGLESVG